LKVRRFAADGGRGAILGALVHNERVMRELEELGLQTIDSLDDATGPTVVFSAHGVPPSARDRARELGLDILDTTCTFVVEIHEEVARALDDGCHVVFVGDPNHREVVGYTHDLDTTVYHVVKTMADVEHVDWENYPKIKVIYQTTLNADDYEDLVRYIEGENPNTVRADTICYATKENQEAIRDVAADPEVDLVLVIGGSHSANTRHLWEIAVQSKPAHHIQGVEDIDPSWLEEVTCVGLTAGASTPDSAIDEVEAFLRSLER
jgi:4-hydroxy-3-methylbut-2-enyl diphosphate reductase